MTKRIDLKKMRKFSDELFDLHDELGYGFVAQEHLDAPNHIVDLINELERCYELIDSGLSMAKKADFQGNRIESLIDALRIIRDDLDEAIAQGHLPIKSADGIDATKIRNFANDALQ